MEEYHERWSLPVVPVMCFIFKNRLFYTLFSVFIMLFLSLPFCPTLMLLGRFVFCILIVLFLMLMDRFSSIFFFTRCISLLFSFLFLFHFLSYLFFRLFQACLVMLLRFFKQFVQIFGIILWHKVP